MKTIHKDTLELTKNLISRESVTPNDAGCQIALADRLQQVGFDIQHMPFGETQNLWARIGNQAPLFVFAGHTDVVPPGPLDQWTHDPYQPTVVDDILYGRGAADMKGSVAAFTVACEHLITKHKQIKGSIALLITSDEEGPAHDGTIRVVEHLKQQNETIDFCLVGEPSCEETVGDTMKIGRRGSLSARITFKGIQGHIAYPHKLINPIHKAMAPLKDLVEQTWDEGDEFFLPTQWQMSNINAGTGANNIIPHELVVECNFRYSPVNTANDLKEQVLSILNQHEIEYEIEWQHSSKPFLSKPNALSNACQQACQNIVGITPEASTTGGTSDGRFLIDISKELVELGPVNKSIHRIDEHVSVKELGKLTEVYLDILEQLLL